MKTLLIGHQKERKALTWLRRQGLKHIDSNYRSRWGEIDLVMQEREILVFVEVRYRKNSRYGGAAASVDRRKQQRLIKTGLSYISSRRIEAPCRFDVVAMQDDNPVEWIRNAFEMET